MGSGSGSGIGGSVSSRESRYALKASKEQKLATEVTAVAYVVVMTGKMSGAGKVSPSKKPELYAIIV